MQMLVTEKKPAELKKHVAVIHSNNRLTLVQRKIANALLYNAYNDLLHKEEHQIHVKALSELIGYDSKDFKSIKNALMKLITTVIEWNLVDTDNLDKEGIWNASAIIADASIDGPICTYSYSGKIRQLLYMPEIYGRIDMAVQSRFTSTYGLALYENCARYQNITQTPWFDMPIFRKLMGVEDNKYKSFKSFKYRVLNKAVSEVNEHSPISVMVKFRKIGRQVTALQFHIKKSDKLLLDSEPTVDINKPLAERLREDYGFSKHQIERIFSNYGEKYILEKIAIIEASPTFRSGKINHLAKYLEKALEKDYQSPKSSKYKVEKTREEERKSDLLKEQKEKSLSSYINYLNDEILKQYRLLSDKQKMDVEKEFCGYLKKFKKIYYELFVKHGMTNILVSDQFGEFVRIKRKDLLEKAMSFDDFIKSEQQLLGKG